MEEVVGYFLLSDSLTGLAKPVSLNRFGSGLEPRAVVNSPSHDDETTHLGSFSCRLGSQADHVFPRPLNGLIGKCCVSVMASSLPRVHQIVVHLEMCRNTANPNYV